VTTTASAPPVPYSNDPPPLASFTAPANQAKPDAVSEVRPHRQKSALPDRHSQSPRRRHSSAAYRGLLYFREEDALFFLGRAAAIGQLVEAVGRQHLVAVVGASGSGKSSMVRAGLVPAQRRQREPAWEITTRVPGDRPLYNFAAALLSLLQPDMDEVARLTKVQELADALIAGRLQLRDVVEQVLVCQPGTQRLLLVIDQWEELFTLTEDAAQRWRLIDGVLEATQKAPLHRHFASHTGSEFARPPNSALIQLQWYF
jgi:hypothetical protein